MQPLITGGILQDILYDVFRDMEGHAKNRNKLLASWLKMGNSSLTKTSRYFDDKYERVVEGPGTYVYIHFCFFK